MVWCRYGVRVLVCAIAASNCAYGDECQTRCLQGSECVNMTITGKPNCVCIEGWTGEKLYRNGSVSCIDDKDECLNEVFNDCPENGMCKNIIGSYRCPCHTGFIKQGKYCKDIDECKNSPCPTNAKCKNSPGSYSCLCDEGYEEKKLTGHCNPEYARSFGMSITTKIAVGVTIGIAFLVIMLVGLVCRNRSHQNETPEVSLQYRAGSKPLSLETATVSHGQIEVLYAVPDTTTKSGGNRSGERSTEELNNQFGSTAHHLSSVAHIKNTIESSY